MKRQVLLAALLLVGLAAFKPYEAPPADAPSATVQFFPSSPFGQWLEARRGNPCAPSRKVASFNGWDSIGFKSVRVQPDERIYLTASSTQDSGPLQHIYCLNTVSFVPEADHSYSIFHGLKNRLCVLEVIDQDSQETPASIEFHDTKSLCRK